jgi:ribose/xylose/arabinose/galactoside ABC-type transport system permease subunit
METKKKRSKDDVIIFFLKNRALTLVLMFTVILSCVSNAFLTQMNILSLARQISANCIIGVGYTLLLASDSVDLSAGYTMCLVGIVSGLLSQAQVPFILILIICIAVGVGCGMLNSLIITKFGLAPFLVTLAMQQIYKGVMMLLCNGTPIGNINSTIVFMGQGYVGPIPFCVILMLIFIIVGAVIFNRTQFGRDVIAVGGNSEAARVSGIDVAKTRLKVGMTLGFTIAITALVSCGRVGSAQTSLGADTVMDIIAAVVIGGTPMGGGSGTVVGTLFGCLVIGLISNGLNLLGVNSYWQMVSKGVIILVAVILDVYSERIYDRMRNKG